MAEDTRQGPAGAAADARRVALVLVSHSALVARGTADVARQMAPDVTVVPAGGTADGGLGTDHDQVLGALQDGLGTGAVVVLTDLGSAGMTAEAALETFEAADHDRVRVAEAPFLEGAVAAAVAAQQGGDLAAVVAAAERAGVAFAPATEPVDEREPAPERPATDVPPAEASTTVLLRDAHGLHARPAAVLARVAARQPVQVRVGGVDAASMLELMRLDARQGTRLEVTASGDGAVASVDAVVAAMVAEGLAEPAG